MFKKRKSKKDKKGKKKKGINLDSIQETTASDHEDELASNLGKRPESFASKNTKMTKKKASLTGQSDNLAKIYQNTITNKELSGQATGKEEIQAQLKKLKQENEAHYTNLDNEKREAVKVYGQEHINPITGKVENGPPVEVKQPSKIKKSQVSAKFGPVRQMRNIQHSNGIDYNPSRCKDFHDSGYCAFGNSCIFIHDRTDYKSGHELDLEWEAKVRRKEERRKRRATKKQNGEDLDPEDLSSEEEGLEDYEEDLVYGDIDEQCLICGEDYKMPSLLPCGHVFCDSCALQQYKDEKTCFKCGKVTGGIFNDGTKLVKKMRQERERIRGKIKVRKNRYGMAPTYLRDMKSNKDSQAFRVVAEDEDKAIVVPKEAIEAAMKRINDF